MSGPVEIARAHWGEALPDWVARLAEECALTSQSRAAGRIGRSPAVVSQVLRNRYGASLRIIEERVRGALMDDQVECPANGWLNMAVCQDWQDKARRFASTNPDRVRMYRACHRCPRFKGSGQ